MSIGQRHALKCNKGINMEIRFKVDGCNFKAKELNRQNHQSWGIKFINYLAYWVWHIGYVLRNPFWLGLILWSQGPEFEAKVAKLVELGFQREAVIQALKLFDGNEEQAAGFLFGWVIWIQNVWSPFLCGLSVLDFSTINLIHKHSSACHSNFKLIFKQYLC